MRPLLPYLRKPRQQVPALAGAVMGLSIFTKNIGALAILMPVALQLGRKTGTSASNSPGSTFGAPTQADQSGSWSKWAQQRPPRAFAA